MITCFSLPIEGNASEVQEENRGVDNSDDELETDESEDEGKIE